MTDFNIIKEKAERLVARVRLLIADELTAAELASINSDSGPLKAFELLLSKYPEYSKDYNELEADADIVVPTGEFDVENYMNAFLYEIMESILPENF